MTQGEQAFPTPDVYDSNGFCMQIGDTGMSLRDYFAGQALVGISCNAHFVAGLSWSADQHKHRSEIAYAIADAMLAARQESAS